MNRDDLEQMRRCAIRVCLLAYKHVLDIGEGFGPEFRQHAKMTYALSRIVSEQQPGVIAEYPTSPILAGILELVEDQEDAVYANYQRDKKLAVLARPLLEAHNGMFELAVDDVLREMSGLREQPNDDVGVSSRGISANDLRARLRTRRLRRRWQRAHDERTHLLEERHGHMHAER